MANPRSSWLLTIFCTHVCRFVPMYLGAYICIGMRKYNITHDASFWKYIQISMYIPSSLYPYYSVYILLHQNYTKYRWQYFPCLLMELYDLLLVAITPIITSNARDTVIPVWYKSTHSAVNWPVVVILRPHLIYCFTSIWS